MAEPQKLTANDYQLLRLSALLQLEDRARKASAKELEFLIVNETMTIVPAQQSALWRIEERGFIAAVSGVARPESSAPYTLWLEQTCKFIEQSDKGKTFHEVAPEVMPPRQAEEWAEWFPLHGFWCPLVRADGTLLGGVLLGRNEPWTDGDRKLLEILFSGYAQSMALHQRVASKPLHHSWMPKNRKHATYIGVGILVLAFLPLRVSVLAPAEIIPASPAPIRAPFDGVIASVNVKPNAVVHVGDKLFTFDTTELKARYEVATKALDMARTEYAGAAQEALNDVQAKSKLTVLQSKIEQQQAEANYDQTLLTQASVVSPIEGVAVFDDPVTWIGKPVVQGERVMLVAPPQDTSLEIQVPATDIVTFTPGAQVLFFSNITPDHPQEGTLTFASYGTTMTAEGVLSYTFRAKLAENTEALRLGLKGTAKIYGDRKPLILWVLRRPIAMLRQWLAF